MDNVGQDPEFPVAQIAEDRDPPEYLLQSFVSLAEPEDVGPDSIHTHGEGMSFTWVRISISDFEAAGLCGEGDKVFDLEQRPALT